LHDFDQSPGEELANSISHGIGLLAALAGAPFLIVAEVRRGDPAGIVGGSIFAATLIVLYLASTLYHALPRNNVKRIFRTLDHGAIFLMIAGTYTPFTLGVLRGPWGWTLFGLVWGLAIAGIALKAMVGARYPRTSTALYLVMGWLVLLAIKPIWLHVPGWGLFWLAAGGLAYTGGVAFFQARSLRFHHTIWHLFVLAGSACHFAAVFWYSA